MREKNIKWEAIIAEYLTGDYTFRQLGVKYGLDFRKIHYWVSKYKGKTKAKQSSSKEQAGHQPLPTEIKQLQSELRKAKLHAEVLEEMLRLSEQLTGIGLRKKLGTKQS